MHIMEEHFFKFMRKDKTRNFLAFLFYFIFILITFTESHLSLILQVICYTTLIIILLLGYILYMIDYAYKMLEPKEEKIDKKIKQELKKIAQEILFFIPVLLLSIFVTSFFMIGISANQSSINESFNTAPILNSIIIIIIVPIIEEYIFRYLPSKFIKNKLPYIIITSVVFAAAHVINDPNAFYYIWFYMIRPLYYGYRYYKTKDIWVTISMHSLNNLIATLLMLAS